MRTDCRWAEKECRYGGFDSTTADGSGDCGADRPCGGRRLSRRCHRLAGGPAGLHRGGCGPWLWPERRVSLRGGPGGPPAGGGPAGPSPRTAGDSAGAGVAAPLWSFLPGLGTEAAGGPLHPGRRGDQIPGGHGGRRSGPDPAACPADGAEFYPGTRPAGGLAGADGALAGRRVHPLSAGGGTGTVCPPGRHPGLLRPQYGPAGPL